MKHVWAKPELKWEGFEPHTYFLNNQKIWELSLKKIPSGDKTTVGEVIATFRRQKVAIENRTVNVVIKSESQEIALTGPHVHLKMLELLYWCADRNISTFDLRWFYFDSDTCLKDPQESYRFFLVAGDQIVDESYSISDWHDNGFDPSLLMTNTDDDRLWSHEGDWRAATKGFWYRKFYKETRTGQLMVLRPDEPQLYYYPEARANRTRGTEAWLAELRRQLSAIRAGIWVLVLLAIFDLIRRWK